MPPQSHGLRVVFKRIRSSDTDLTKVGMEKVTENFLSRDQDMEDVTPLL